MLREKLYSESGATLVLALIFFLLCAVAGSVILVAGSGAAGRLADMKSDQQAYYSTTSAARMMKNELSGLEYSINDGTLNIAQGNDKSALQEIIEEGLKYDYENPGDNYSTDGEVSYPGDSRLDVKFKFTMDSSRRITIEIAKKDSNEKTQYICTLSAPSKENENTGTGRWGKANPDNPDEKDTIEIINRSVSTGD